MKQEPGNYERDRKYGNRREREDERRFSRTSDDSYRDKYRDSRPNDRQVEGNRNYNRNYDRNRNYRDYNDDRRVERDEFGRIKRDGYKQSNDDKRYSPEYEQRNTSQKYTSTEYSDRKLDESRHRDRNREGNVYPSRRDHRSNIDDPSNSKRERSPDTLAAIQVHQVKKVKREEQLEPYAQIPEEVAEEVKVEPIEDAEMLKLFGFGNFGTTKNTHVQPDVSATSAIKQRKHRQIMNRARSKNL